ncbi:MAG: SprB repeat-containing protein, partial [Bacteroidales bacterium]|nr:SprB repeat-containing protein [Bacteroidales bacterium]
MLLIKISSDGTIKWIRQIGSNLNESAGGITIDNSNNIYLTGNYSGICKFTSLDSLISKGDYDVFLAKYKTNGDLDFAKTLFSGTQRQISNDINFDGSEHLVIAGLFKDSLIINNFDTLRGNTFYSQYISSFDMDGNPFWVKRFLTNDNGVNFYRVKATTSGYVFTGFFKKSIYFDIKTITSKTTANFDGFIFKTDTNGNSQWVRTIKGISTENIRAISGDEYENIYILGNSNSPSLELDSTEVDIVTYQGNLGGYDTFFAKYNRSGILQWLIKKGSSSTDIYYDLEVKNNVIYATGYFTNQMIFNNDTLNTTSTTNSDVFLAAFNEIGDPISGVSITGTGDYYDTGINVGMDASSRAYVSGYYRSPQIQIGDQTYTSDNFNKSDLFFAIYEQPFKAVITDERMVSCNGLSDGMLTVTPYFGTPPYTYSWSHNPSLNSAVADNLPADTYTVTITDGASRVASISGTVSQSAELTLDGLLTPVSCYNGNNGAIDLTVTGGTAHSGYDYSWTSTNGSGIVPIDEDQSGLSEGTYSVTVKDDNLCSASSDFVITQPAPISFNGTAITEIEKPIPPGHLGSINLVVTGGNTPYSFAWTGPDGFTAFFEDIANLDTAGLYNLTLTDNKGCITDTTFAVIDNFTFVAEISAKTDVLCHGTNDGSATVSVFNGTGPYTYQWNPGPTLIDIATNNGMAPGNYTVTVTDAAFKTATAAVTIKGPAAPLNLVLSVSDLQCAQDNSGVANLTVTGGTIPYAYNWDNGYTGEDLVNVAANVYTITVTDANGCQAQAIADIEEPAIIGLDITAAGTILCAGDKGVSLTANTSGGIGSFSYQWNDPGTQTTKTAFDLEAGNYNVMVTDENGCTKTASATIIEPAPLTLDAVVTQPSCPGTTDGSIVPTISGGTPGFDYVWSNGIFERVNDELAPNTYTLTVTDNNNCTLVQEFVLTGPDTLKITSVDITDVSCLGKQDGALSIQTTGGTGDIQYSNNGGTDFTASPDFTALLQGDYILVARDANNCLSETYPVKITVTDTVRIAGVEATDPTCLGIENGSLTITAIGGSGVYQYSADGGTSFVDESVISSLTSGNFQVVARDGNDCLSEAYPVTLVYTDTIRLASVTPTDLTCADIP